MMEVANRLLMSPMVVLELQYLRESGKISIDAGVIAQTLRQQFGIQVDEEGTGAAIVHAVSVDWTRDPFDRIIASQAMTQNAYLLTRDERIRDYFAYAVW